MYKAKVGVLMGGLSLEREVSFNSGRTVCDHLDVNKYDVIPLFQDSNGLLYILPWSFLYRGKISDFQFRLKNEASLISWSELKNRVDIVFPAVHGRFAEDGTLQGMLETLGIPYFGSGVFSSAAMSNKAFHEELLKINGISVPRGCIIKNDNFISDPLYLEFIEKIKFPYVVKPIGEGSSFGVQIVNNFDELKNAISVARNIDNRFAQDAIIQEKINGMEFSCIAIERDNSWHAFNPTEIVHKESNYFYGYIDKYMPGSGIKYTPARCNNKIAESIKKTVEKIAHIIDAKYIIRVDGFVDENEEIVIIESNPFPGMAPSSFTFLQAACDGFSPADLIDFLISTALKNYKIDSISDFNKPMDNKMIQKKMRVGVLLGGGSNEAETSLDSGRNVVYKLSKYSYDAVPLFMKKDGSLYIIDNELLVKNTTFEISEKLTDSMFIDWQSLPEKFDFIFIGLHGGLGENGSVQGILEMLGLPYNGSGVLASSLCMNKDKTKSLLSSFGFDVPGGFLLQLSEYDSCADIFKLHIEKKMKELGLKYPVIAKPYDDGCSCMVECCNNYEELFDAVKKIFESGKNGCLIEELIQSMEITVGVIGNDNPHAFLPTYTPKRSHVLSLTEKFLPGDGQNITPAPFSVDENKFIQIMAEKAYKALGCSGYARLDCFFEPALKNLTGEPRIIFLECNTLPALTPATCLFHQAAEDNIRPMELIEKIVNFGLERHNKHSFVADSHKKDFCSL